MRLLDRADGFVEERVRRGWRAMADGIAVAGRRRLWAVDGPVGPLTARALLACVP